MFNAVFFIDGFNFYHSLIDDDPLMHVQRYSQYKWLNYRKLCELFISKSICIRKILFFTALTVWNQDKVLRHKQLIKALQSIDIEIVYGKFKRKDRTCRICKKTYRTHEEKQTDVNIAIELLSLAYQNVYDIAYIISGDSDLIPSIQAVQKTFPNKKINIIFPMNRTSLELKQIVDRSMKIKETHLISSLFEREIALRNGEKITCPDSWVNPKYHI